jgi:hypothetical protein
MRWTNAKPCQRGKEAFLTLGPLLLHRVLPGCYDIQHLSVTNLRCSPGVDGAEFADPQRREDVNPLVTGTLQPLVPEIITD